MKQFLIAAFLVLMMGTAFADTTKDVVGDSLITTNVKAQLLANSVTHATTIHVETQKGVVRLTGTVDSQTEASTAVEIAQSAAGVNDVDASTLVVQNSSQPLQDSYITAKVKGMFLQEKLFNTTDIPVTSITVETQNGVVYLSGNVNSAKIADKAKELAQRVHGVKSVQSTIKVQ